MRQPPDCRTGWHVGIVEESIRHFNDVLQRRHDVVNRLDGIAEKADDVVGVERRDGQQVFLGDVAVLA